MSHSRNASDETTASSYSHILEHVLQYPGSYEIPLRTMYTLNCTRASPLSKESRASTSTNCVSPTSSQFNESESAAVNFTSQLMSHIGSLPTQPTSLPPSFITSFVARCFHPSLSLVDFPQALTALDYLRDLEKRRCREYVAAFERLGIHIESFDADVENVTARYPGIALWAKNMHGKNAKAQNYYSVMYLGLRRWIMINELSLQPFNKLNCMGMLNTLLPPQDPSGNVAPPTPLVTLSTLREERNGFFDYIRMVQKNGPTVLQPVMEMNKNPEDETGWDNLQKTVDKYLRVAKNMIDDCISTTGTDDFKAVEDGRKGKKTDSGISFGSGRRPSAGSGIHDKPNSIRSVETQQVKGLSTLEKINREFKRMRVKTRPDVDEIVKPEPVAPPQHSGEDKKKKKSIKKARSFANLGGLRAGNASSSSLVASRNGSDAEPFDAEEMKRRRMMYEASKANKN